MNNFTIETACGHVSEFDPKGDKTENELVNHLRERYPLWSAKKCLAVLAWREGDRLEDFAEAEKDFKENS